MEYPSNLNELAKLIGEQNQERGWHDRHDALVVDMRMSLSDESETALLDHLASKTALIGTEVAEAIEELRGGDLFGHIDGETGKPEGFEYELADVLIRTLDLMAMLEMDVEDLVHTKLQYNENRPKMHGKRF